MAKKRHRPELDPIRSCRHCGEYLYRRRYPSGALESTSRYRLRVYCYPKDRDCMKNSLRVGGRAYMLRSSAIRARQAGSKEAEGRNS